jgi:hypothetical protein
VAVEKVQMKDEVNVDGSEKEESREKAMEFVVLYDCVKLKEDIFCVRKA